MDASAFSSSPCFGKPKNGRISSVKGLSAGRILIRPFRGSGRSFKAKTETFPRMCFLLAPPIIPPKAGGVARRLRILAVITEPEERYTKSCGNCLSALLSSEASGIDPSGHLVWPSGLQERNQAPHGGGVWLRQGGAEEQKKQSAERGEKRKTRRMTSFSVGSDRHAVRALRCPFFLLESLTICSMERTFPGCLFLKCLKYSSSIYSGNGNFQGCCFVLAGQPNSLGFNPSSRAIWM